MMILDSGVERSMQLRPTSRHPPKVVILIHWSLDAISRWILRPTVRNITFLSFCTLRK